jgi:hypothetical protein
LILYYFDIGFTLVEIHTMNLQEFKSSADDDKPPQGISPALEAMWYQLNGDWDSAHRLVQSQNNLMGNWVHAYLHRVEGDDGNASHWYHRAEKPVCTSTLADEWREIVMVLVSE